jgi:hypothetical protein
MMVLFLILTRIKGCNDTNDGTHFYNFLYPQALAKLSDRNEHDVCKQNGEMSHRSRIQIKKILRAVLITIHDSSHLSSFIWHARP